MFIRRIAVIVVALLAVAGPACYANSFAPSSSSPDRLVLQLGDVPTGFSRALSRRATRATVVRDQGSVPRGWTSGWEAQFKADNPIGGIAEIHSSASIYDSVQNAHASMLESYASTAAAVRAGNQIKRLSVGAPLGNEARMYTYKQRSGGTTFVLYAVMWRSRAVKATVFCAGLSGSLRPAQVVALARKQQRRIAQNR